MRRTLLAFITFLLFCHNGLAQVTTEGTEFWFGFMQNNDLGQLSSLEVFFTSKEEASVTMFLYRDGSTQNFTVSPQQTVKRIIDASPNNSYAATGSGSIQSRAVRVTSDVPISLYAFNNRQASGDATVILPVGALGQKYYVSAYHEVPPAGDTFAQGLDQSQFMVVATADNTTINITPKVTTTDGKPQGQMFAITLNQGDLYQLQANGDLTGSLVESASGDEEDCKNFAVFGGNLWTRVTAGDDCAVVNRPGGFAADHLYEQMYPTNTWGRNYTAIPFELRRAYVLRTTATEDGTTVTIGGSTRSLDAGESVTTVHTFVTTLSADKPIQVAQFSQSLSCDAKLTTGPGDPFMLMLSPDEQQLREITFNALPAPQITNYFITLITPTADRENLVVGNAPLGPAADFQTVAGNSALSYIVLPTAAGGDVTVRSETGFIAYVYGFGNIESFGYVAGASLENLNVQILGEDPFIARDVISQEGCINSPIAFSARFDVEPGQDPRYNTFDWDFGDGSTGTGQDTVHLYAEAGVYEITLVASDGNTSCGGNSEVITGTVTITDVEVNPEGIVGAPSVCPDVDGVVYQISGAGDNTYEWEIEGGDIVSDNGTEITVNWGAANDDAYLRVLPRNYLGCPGDTLTLPVRINKRLEPLLPAGPAEVCFTDFENVVYATPFTNGSKYKWTVEGGAFINGMDSTNQVSVAWDGVGTGRLYYREFNPDISECEGFSPVLDVVVYETLTSNAVVSDVLCHDGSSGSIGLALTGGKPGGVYTVDWSNGMSGADISGLPAGEYRATIRDAIGCVLEQTYMVEEPPVLEITDSHVIDVRCFEESNGIISVAASGGTPDSGGEYVYRWSGDGIAPATTTEGMISGLPAGNYSVTVTDTNGCTVSSDFFVGEPQKLLPDLETLINLPICPDASDGTAFLEAKGGTPDYQFFWSNNPGIDQQLGENLSRGTYTVTIVDANGCSETLEVEVTERFPRIFIPNAFSPNGDGENDNFKPVTDCDLTYSIQVFNEWGAVIFSTNDITEGWKGTLNGQPVPNGKYSYIIFYSGSLNGVSFEETLRGTVRVYR